jgi:hypothetical protein
MAAEVGTRWPRLSRRTLDGPPVKVHLGFSILEAALNIEQLRENATNCAILAEEATNEPSRRRYQRMHDAWIALIETEAWLEGALPYEISQEPTGAAV